MSEEMTTDSYQGPADPGLTDVIQDPVGLLSRRWRPMALILAAGVVATLLYAFLPTPMYMADATVLVASQRVSEDFVRQPIEDDLSERVTALRSEVLARPNLTKVIERNDLYPDMRQSAGMDAAISELRANIEVQAQRSMRGRREERAQLLSILFYHEDPQVAARVANDVADTVTSAGIRLRAQQARLTTEFMRRELEAAETALREQAKKISEFQQTHRGRLPSELESSLRRLQRLQDQRNSLALQVIEAQTRIAQMTSSAGLGASRLEQLNAQLARELAVNTENHPNVVALRRQIDNVRRQGGGYYGGVPSGVLDGVQREVAQLESQLAETDAEIRTLDAQVAAIPAVGEEFGALEQRASVLRENYLEFLRKLKDAELAESLELAQQGDRVAILDPANPPLEPIHTPGKTIALGILLSIALAGFVGLVLERVDPVLVSPGALEVAGQAQVLGSVPRIA